MQSFWLAGGKWQPAEYPGTPGPAAAMLQWLSSQRRLQGAHQRAHVWPSGNPSCMARKGSHLGSAGPTSPQNIPRHSLKWWAVLCPVTQGTKLHPAPVLNSSGLGSLLSQENSRCAHAGWGPGEPPQITIATVGRAQCECTGYSDQAAAANVCSFVLLFHL